MKFLTLLTPLLLCINGAVAHYYKYCLCAADGKGEDDATIRVCNRYIEGVWKTFDGSSPPYLGKTIDGLDHDLCVGTTEETFAYEEFEAQCKDVGKVASFNCWNDGD